MLTTYSCNKEQGAPPLSPDEILRQEIAAKLEQDAYPMNLLSREAKDELISGMVIVDAQARCFEKTSLVNQELEKQAIVDLLETLTMQGLELFDLEGNILYRGKLAQAADIMNDPTPAPIGPIHHDIGWDRVRKCCGTSNIDGYCIGQLCN